MLQLRIGFLSLIAAFLFYHPSMHYLELGGWGRVKRQILTKSVVRVNCFGFERSKRWWLWWIFSVASWILMARTPSNSHAHVYLWYANMGYFKRMSTAPILLLFLYFWGRGAFPPGAARRTCLPAKNSVWLTLKAFIRVCLYIYCLIIFLWRETGGFGEG